MRIIFSRKGFDSSAGGCPSPIIDGQLRSLPIPSQQPSPTTFADLPAPYPTLIERLTRQKITGETFCHLDPDIDASLHPQTMTGWRGSLGQSGAAQGHLRNQNVQAGDLFLFWGLFQDASCNSQGQWRFIAQPHHRIWGWMQIDEVVHVTDAAAVLAQHPWLQHHPHLMGDWGKQNTLYLAKQQLQLPELSGTLPGFGTFQQGHALTVPGEQRSLWHVPRWLHPRSGGCGLSYHGEHRWQSGGQLLAASRGQEFVADIGRRRKPLHWFAELLRSQGIGY